MRYSLILILSILISFSSQAQFGSLSKWFNKEVIPTIKGERPLKIDPTRIRVSHKGKDIIRASTKGNGSVYVDFGVAKLQTSNLKKRMAQTAAIFSGNTAVMGQVAFEQFQKQYEKELKDAQEKNLVRISKTPPPPPNPIQSTGRNSRDVVIYNHTSRKISYALNGYFYELNTNSGYRHTSKTGEFFLQYDDDHTRGVHIARYYLTGSEYSLYLYEGMDNIAIHRY